MEKQLQQMSITDPKTPSARPPQQSFPVPVMPPRVSQPVISAGRSPASSRDLFDASSAKGQTAPP